MAVKPTHDSSATESRVESAIRAVRAGRGVLLSDDAEPEKKADLIVAAELVTVEMMALLIRACGGIVCLCMTGDALERLRLPQMVAHNESRYGTAFTVSIEARDGVSTGVSAADRVRTVRAAVSTDASAKDVVSPGHVFPIRAHPGGILARRGHTEGSIELARLAGLDPAAVLCELMNEDGTMAGGDDVCRFSRLHRFPMPSVEELHDHVARSMPRTGRPIFPEEAISFDDLDCDMTSPASR